VVAGGLLVGWLAAPVGAAFLLRSDLVLSKGEDPSVSADCVAAGDARWDGTVVRVTLGNMDPARFPDTPGACKATVKAGKITRVVPLVLAPADECVPAVDATSADMRVPGKVKAGNKVSVAVKCKVGGVIHSTTWTTKF
jgi:hypothetical protein